MNKIIKCEGRFSTLRDFVFTEAIPLVVKDSKKVILTHLEDIFDLIEQDLFQFDPNDPYFNFQGSHNEDKVLGIPELNPLSLVPLFPSNYELDKSIIIPYVETLSTKEGVKSALTNLFTKPLKIFKETLAQDPNNIVFPGGATMKDYFVSGNYGIGSTCYGGEKGGGIRSDSPFLLELNKAESNGKGNLAGVIGFWIRKNSLIVSQMQSCKNAKLPQNIPFGIGCLKIAEIYAKKIGCDSIKTYSAKNHPIFKEHPENWQQLGSDFSCIWDSSAKKLGFEGSRSTLFYQKNF